MFPSLDIPHPWKQKLGKFSQDLNKFIDEFQTLIITFDITLKCFFLPAVSLKKSVHGGSHPSLCDKIHVQDNTKDVDVVAVPYQALNLQYQFGDTGY